MSDKAIKLFRRNSTEENKRVLERWVQNNPEMKEFREGLKESTRIDISDPKAFPVMESGFSWKEFKKKALRESLSASSFPQLLRAGVQTMVNQMYSAVGTTFESWAHVIPSSKDTELYAPLHGMTFLSEVGPGEKAIESNMAGLDLRLKNRGFAEIFPLEKELVDDDQTGQVTQLAGLMAEYAKLAVEVYCYGKLQSVSGMSYSNLTVPTSETKPSNESTYPYSTALIGGGKTRPGSFGALTQANMQSGLIALMNQLNLLGLKMLVNPDTIIASPHYRFDLSVLLNSSMNPAGAASAGVTGGAFSANPIQNVVNPVISRFVFDQNGSVNADSKAWYLCDSSKPAFVVQMREPASVLLESPEAGESFDRRLYRWRLFTRFNSDFIDPRFFWQGSDGSV